MSVRIATANTDFALRGDPAYLERLCSVADVLCLQEAKDTFVGLHLPKGWLSLQEGTVAHDQARMGSCVAYNSDVLEVVAGYLVVGTEPFWLGRRLGLLTRYIAVSILRDKFNGRVLTVVSAHNAPWRFRVLQPGYVRNLHRELDRHNHWVVGTDANAPIEGLAKALGGMAYGFGIVGFVSNMQLTKVRRRPWGVQRGVTDHPAVTATANFPR